MRIAAIPVFVSILLSFSACSQDREAEQSTGKPNKSINKSSDDENEEHDIAHPRKSQKGGSRKHSEYTESESHESTDESSDDEPRPNRKKHVRFADKKNTKARSRQNNAPTAIGQGSKQAMAADDVDENPDDVSNSNAGGELPTPPQLPQNLLPPVPRPPVYDNMLAAIRARPRLKKVDSIHRVSGENSVAS